MDFDRMYDPDQDNDGSGPTASVTKRNKIDASMYFYRQHYLSIIQVSEHIWDTKANQSLSLTFDFQEEEENSISSEVPNNINSLDPSNSFQFRPGSVEALRAKILRDSFNSWCGSDVSDSINSILSEEEEEGDGEKEDSSKIDMVKGGPRKKPGSHIWDHLPPPPNATTSATAASGAAKTTTTATTVTSDASVKATTTTSTKSSLIPSAAASGTTTLLTSTTAPPVTLAEEENFDEDEGVVTATTCGNQSEKNDRCNKQKPISRLSSVVGQKLRQVISIGNNGMRTKSHQGGGSSSTTSPAAASGEERGEIMSGREMERKQAQLRIGKNLNVLNLTFT